MIDNIGRFAPGLRTLINYEKDNLRYDIVAGLSVAAVALPVGIAYAELAGVPTVVGIYSAIFPLFAYALFGSSRQLITGPDAATCMMAATAIGAMTVSDPGHYAILMVALSLMTGLFYIIAGVARLGFIVNYISQPMLVGYLNGIALIILIGQLPKLFGFSAGGDSFFPQVAAFVEGLDSIHLTTLILGGSLLLLLFMLKRFSPNSPGPLIVAVIGIIAVMSLGLEDLGVAVVGAVPSGLPDFQLPTLEFSEFRQIFRDAGGIMLISFASGILTAKSFAQAGGYNIDANQELIGFGAINIASGLAQGFPVSGADSRTAVNKIMGGRTQMTGIIAAVTMLFFLLLMTQSLANLPTTALAAIIIVSAFGLFDFAALRELREASGREWLFSVATTIGVLYFGVLPGVVFAILLTLLWLLMVGSRPHDAVLGKVPNLDGFHDISEYPDATTIPGLLIYRFDSNLIFFNCDYFKDHVLQNADKQKTPVEWVLIDASPINLVDYTALQRLRELYDELASREIDLAYAGAKQNLAHFFRQEWVKEQDQRALMFPTLQSGIEAFKQRNTRKAASMPGKR